MSGAPPELGLQALMYVCTIQNHWQLPASTTKHSSNGSLVTLWTTQFVGIAEQVGSAMTFKILTSKGEIIHRSIVCSAASEGVYNNKRANTNARKAIVEKDTAATYPGETFMSKRDKH